jgi:hypothetical protein
MIQKCSNCQKEVFRNAIRQYVSCSDCKKANRDRLSLKYRLLNKGKVLEKIEEPVKRKQIHTEQWVYKKQTQKGSMISSYTFEYLTGDEEKDIITLQNLHKTTFDQILKKNKLNYLL